MIRPWLSPVPSPGGRHRAYCGQAQSPAWVSAAHLAPGEVPSPAPSVPAASGLCCSWRGWGPYPTRILNPAGAAGLRSQCQEAEAGGFPGRPAWATRTIRPCLKTGGGRQSGLVRLFCAERLRFGHNGSRQTCELCVSFWFCFVLHFNVATKIGKKASFQVPWPALVWVICLGTAPWHLVTWPGLDDSLTLCAWMSLAVGATGTSGEWAGPAGGFPAAMEVVKRGHCDPGPCGWAGSVAVSKGRDIWDTIFLRHPWRPAPSVGISLP